MVLITGDCLRINSIVLWSSSINISILFSLITFHFRLGVSSPGPIRTISVNGIFIIFNHNLVKLSICFGLAEIIIISSPTFCQTFKVLTIFLSAGRKIKQRAHHQGNFVSTLLHPDRCQYTIQINSSFQFSLPPFNLELLNSYFYFNYLLKKVNSLFFLQKFVKI